MKPTRRPPSEKPTNEDKSPISMQKQGPISADLEELQRHLIVLSDNISELHARLAPVIVRIEDEDEPADDPVAEEESVSQIEDRIGQLQRRVSAINRHVTQLRSALRV